MRLWDGIRSRCCACKIAAPVVALNVVFSCAAAQSPAENSPPLKPESMTVLDSTPAWVEVVPVELKDPTTAAEDLCRDKPGDPDWLSQLRAGLYRTICSSAAWFDGFFGNARFDDEYEAIHGSEAVGAATGAPDGEYVSKRSVIKLRSTASAKGPE